MVAELDGRVAGFGAARQTGIGPAAVSMLCDLFVDPAAHGRGCGRAMLADLWAGPQPRMTFSSLHANALPLYTSFGLDAWWPLLYLHGDAGRLPAISEWSAEPVTAGLVARFELAWTGANRLSDHLYWAARPGGQCLLVSRDAEVIAAGTVISSGQDRGIVHLALSPAVDDGAAAAAVLLTLAELPGPRHELAHACLPAPHPAVRALLAAGWQFGEFDLFMATDPYCSTRAGWCPRLPWHDGDLAASRRFQLGVSAAMAQDADALVIGAGLAGLVATAELAAAGRRVILLDQEPEASLGGQAFWSFGGLFLVDSPEQRRMGIRDSHDLAWQDWLGSAAFDRPEDAWPRRWAEAYVGFAAGPKRQWLHDKGVRFFPIVGWAERGGYGPAGHGNSVPRFHITWGTGPGVVAPFEREVRAAAESGQVRMLFRHQVDGLTSTAGGVDGVRGSILAPSGAARGQPTSREVTGEFELHAQAVVVASGGIGGNHDLVRQHWPPRLGNPPQHLLSGVPAHVDGRMLGISQAAGAAVINPDRMWHYTEGIENWNPVWPLHGIRILPGPSSMWLDARGRQLPGPLYPGFDTLGTLEHIMTTGFEYTWFLLTQKIIEREFALSGSEQNPDLTGKSVMRLLERAKPGPPAPVAAFMRHGADFVVESSLPALVAGMNRLTGAELLDLASVTELVEARDREVANPFTKDMQLTAIHGARRYRGDRLIRVAKPHRFLDPAAGPLVAVRLHILTRKSLGGLQTNLDGQVLDEAGQPVPGLYAAGEVAGFGGGGMHGYRALEGTFLGGCLFSGRTAGRAVARAV